MDLSPTTAGDAIPASLQRAVMRVVSSSNAPLAVVKAAVSTGHQEESAADDPPLGSPVAAQVWNSIGAAGAPPGLAEMALKLAGEGATIIQALTRDLWGQSTFREYASGALCRFDYAGGMHEWSYQAPQLR